ncbi:MAG: hypothetical protein V7L20_23000 [Nostoc sp.]
MLTKDLGKSTAYTVQELKFGAKGDKQCWTGGRKILLLVNWAISLTAWLRLPPIE